MIYCCTLRIETGQDKHKDDLLSTLGHLLSNFSYLGPALMDGSTITLATKDKELYTIALDKSRPAPNFVIPQDLHAENIECHLSLVARISTRCKQ